MQFSRILPVIDLMRGQVVHGIAGRRASYQPLRSCLVEGSSPRTVAAALRRLGFRSCYVADLDGILTGQTDDDAYQQVCGAGLHVWLDAGFRDLATMQAWLRRHAAHTGPAPVPQLIVGLESLRSADELKAMIDHLGEDAVVFSLDLREGRPVSSIGDWQDRQPLDIVRAVESLGVRRLIVLDLASVGTRDGGSTHPLCRQIRDEFPQLQLISGGGVRHLADIDAFFQAGCDRVLVASGLHHGELVSAIRARVLPEEP